MASRPLRRLKRARGSLCATQLCDLPWWGAERAGSHGALLADNSHVYDDKPERVAHDDNDL